MTAEASKNVSVLSGGNQQNMSIAESQAKAMHIIDSSRIKIKPTSIISNQQPINKNIKI